MGAKSRLLIFAYTFALVAVFFASTRPSNTNAPGLSSFGTVQAVQATGATATVFHYKLPNGTSFAVKTFLRKKKGIPDDAYRASVQNEWIMVSKLSHKNVLPILDFLYQDGLWHSVMPYIPVTLFDRTLGDGRPLTDQEEDLIFAQIVDGVAHMHERGVAHLDLKPSNILLEDGRNVKIIDFGHSKHFKLVKYAKVQGRLGTPPNVPLEAYRAVEYNPFAADVWAVGMLYCQLKMPTVPWNLGQAGTDQFAIFDPSAADKSILKHEAQVQATIEMLGRHLPEFSRHLILGMLRANPDQRISMETARSTGWIQEILNSQSERI